MIKGYFQQTVQYFSECRGEFRLISELHPKHAGNAAEKLLREADFWSKEADVQIDRPALWMTTTPIFRALVTRAGIDAR